MSSSWCLGCPVLRKNEVRHTEQSTGFSCWALHAQGWQPGGTAPVLGDVGWGAAAWFQGPISGAV